MRNIEIDLEKDILEGWQRFYDSLNVSVLRLAKERGHRFPPVDVVFEEGVYRLVFGAGSDDERINYGGHSRGVLALQDRFPLLCRVLAAHRTDPPKEDPHVRYRPIQEIPPERKTGADALYRLNKNLQFLPARLRKKFIKENSLVVLPNENLITQEDLDNPPPF